MQAFDFMGNTPESISARLLAVLKTRGMKQASLARLSGLSPSEISRYVRGKRKPTLQSLEIMAPHLELGLAELVAGTDMEDKIAPELRFVTREQHEQVVSDGNAAIAQNIELRERLEAYEQQLARQNTDLLEQEDECEQLRAELVACDTASSEMKGRLRESQEHVFLLEQTVQAQAAELGSKQRLHDRIMESLCQTESKYRSLKTSHDELAQEYVSLLTKHEELPTPSTDPAPVLVAGLLGLALGAAGGVAFSD